MKIVKGNNLIELTKEEFKKLREHFECTHIDIGTGDGRFIYKSALRNKKTLFIGIDPSQKQIEIYSKKSCKKRLSNTLFVLSSIEQLPTELFGIADYVQIWFPWGTLLEYIAKPDLNMVYKITNLLKNNGQLEIVFGYDEKLEPAATKKHNLEQLDTLTVNEKIAAAFKYSSVKITRLKELKKAELRKRESTWGKRLSYGKDRPVYMMQFKKIAD
jgi:16S rRNA (adenine(1408)-N(1))-methyltransferase